MEKFSSEKEIIRKWRFEGEDDSYDTNEEYKRNSDNRKFSNNEVD